MGNLVLLADHSYDAATCLRLLLVLSIALAIAVFAFLDWVRGSVIGSIDLAFLSLNDLVLDPG